VHAIVYCRCLLTALKQDVPGCSDMLPNFDLYVSNIWLGCCAYIFMIAPSTLNTLSWTEVTHTKQLSYVA
jgi:hypothetical protein